MDLELHLKAACILQGMVEPANNSFKAFTVYSMLKYQEKQTLK